MSTEFVEIKKVWDSIIVAKSKAIKAWEPDESFVSELQSNPAGAVLVLAQKIAEEMSKDINVVKQQHALRKLEADMSFEQYIIWNRSETKRMAFHGKTMGAILQNKMRALFAS